MHFDILPSINRISLEHLRHLSLSNCCLTALQHFFRQIPRLSSLKTSLLFLNPEEINILANIHEMQPTPLGLISLSLSINAPGDCVERRFLNANRWEKFIVEHLPKLMTFDFKFCSGNIDRKVLDRFRSSFWLDKYWFVAFNSSCSLLFTVPHFAPTSMNCSFAPVLSDCTTLPLEQHIIFYDRITKLRYESNQTKLPYRYNYVKELILDDPYMHDNIVYLSKIQSLIVNTSDWSLDKVITLIKEAMPSVNHLRLNCTQSNVQYKYFPDISLPQIRILSLPQYGRYTGKIIFNWSKLFPCVERLIASINSKKQIPFLIDHFKNMINGFFVVDDSHYDMKQRIKVTRQWLKKHSYRLKGINENNFICQINDQYLFSLCLWIGENDEIDK
ncbi:unnamed protein product [Rotaria sp. Silwood2]|nr:unnamed protein product [Rotaria sp. Silwood2]